MKAKGPRIDIADRDLPTDKWGEVKFESLEQMLEYFRDWEIVALVERQISNRRSSNESNKKRDKELRAMARAVKQIAKEHLQKEYAELTAEEMNECVRIMKEGVKDEPEAEV